MNDLYDMLGISKQAHHKSIKGVHRSVQRASLIVTACNNIRKHHRRIGCVKMYSLLCGAVGLGRDRFLACCRDQGLFIRQRRNPYRTTVAAKVNLCDNLIDGMNINGINQIWQSDIFYIKDGNRQKYGYTIIDVYSRRLISLHLADNLRAENLKKAIEIAIRKRKPGQLKGCIFHSDRGSQYVDSEVRKLLKKLGMKQSMAVRPQQNSYAERVQGTIKNEYLLDSDETRSMKSRFTKTMNLYNIERPHKNLGMINPVEFERKINNLPKSKRPELQIYQWIEPVLTFPADINKKEKSSKKEKTNTYSLIN